LPESICSLSSLDTLDISWNKLSSLPTHIGNLSHLNYLNLRNNKLVTLPESICNLSQLTRLNLDYNKLASLPDDFGNLTSLENLHLGSNQLIHLPESIGNLTNLTFIDISKNPISQDVSVLQILSNLPNLESVYFLGVQLPRRYWVSSFSDWKPEWLLDEENVEIKRMLIQEVGYEKICQELNAKTIDNWREYTLLKIADIDRAYDEDTEKEILEPMVLLKMTCPSTGHIHILRVPPEMTSAEAAITWVNHGIHPDEFAIQT
jgi:leucine-rich repeat protein SHOC2